MVFRHEHFRNAIISPLLSFLIIFGWNFARFLHLFPRQFLAKNNGGSCPGHPRELPWGFQAISPGDSGLGDSGLGQSGQLPWGFQAAPQNAPAWNPQGRFTGVMIWLLTLLFPILSLIKLWILGNSLRSTIIIYGKVILVHRYKLLLIINNYCQQRIIVDR